MYYKHLPIWQQANRLLLAIELTVRHFSRYNKYSLGAELRKTAMRLCQTIHRAVTRKRSRLKLIQQVSELTDDIKFQIQLAKDAHAFASFAQFQSVVELAVTLGKQAGGWYKQARAEVIRLNVESRVSTHCAPSSR